jgi:hypothetical protein
MKNILIIICILFSFSCCSPQKEQIKTNELTGLWKLHSMEVRDTLSNQWKPWREGTQGYLLYDNHKHVSLHLTTAFYNSFNNAFPNFTDTIPTDALKHLTNNYNYMGNYETKDSVVRHIKLSHSNPNEWGDTAYRKFYFKKDTLIMVPIEQKNAQLMLKWVPFKST